MPDAQSTPPVRRPHPAQHPGRLSLLAACAALCFAPIASAQDGPFGAGGSGGGFDGSGADAFGGGGAGGGFGSPGGGGGASSDAEFQAYPLTHTTTREAMQMLDALGVLDTARIAADERSNRLLVMAGPAAHEHLAAVLESLDVASPADSATHELETRWGEAEVLYDFARRSGVRIVGFTQVNGRSIVTVTGSDEAAAQFRQAVQRNDIPAGPRPTQVRLAWLVGDVPEGVEGFAARRLPDDLRPAVVALEEIGVRDVRLMGQLLIRVNGGGGFEANGVVATDEAGDALQRLVCVGQFVEEGISIDVSLPEMDLSLSTVLSAPPEHAVVLGASPFGRMTSAFVVMWYAEESPAAAPQIGERHAGEPQAGGAAAVESVPSVEAAPARRR